MNFNLLIADKDREYPFSHPIQLLCLLGFFSIWFLDSFIFKLSINLSYSIPLFVRLCVFLVVLLIAVKLVQLAHDTLLSGHDDKNQVDHEHHHPDKLINTGIMAYVRHPLYLGLLLVYLAFVLVTLSIASFFGWVIVFIIHDRMASFEEKQLEKIFGNRYSDYKKQVPKWFPLNLLFFFNRE